MTLHGTRCRVCRTRVLSACQRDGMGLAMWGVIVVAPIEVGRAGRSAARRALIHLVDRQHEVGFEGTVGPVFRAHDPARSVRPCHVTMAMDGLVDVTAGGVIAAHIDAARLAHLDLGWCVDLSLLAAAVSGTGCTQVQCVRPVRPPRGGSCIECVRRAYRCSTCITRGQALRARVVIVGRAVPTVRCAVDVAAGPARPGVLRADPVAAVTEARAPTMMMALGPPALGASRRAPAAGDMTSRAHRPFRR